ncbi:hypothetical protein PMAYCL1PPCAC_20523, partial [Pristionchus mayeri]
VKMAHELSPIEQLPEEILYEIIGNALESIFSLKLVSKYFNDRVDAYLKRSRALRLADRLDMEWTQDDVTRVTVGLQLEKVVLFKLRLNRHVISDDFPWSKIDSSNPDWRIIEPYQWKFHVSDDVHPLQYFTFDFVATEEFLNNLNKCLGGSSNASLKQEIGNVYLYTCDSKPTFRREQQLHFRKLLSGINVREFHYGGNISNEDVEFINEFIEDHNVYRLNLQQMETTVSDPVSALLGFSSRVRSLYLNENLISINEKWEYMFGLHSVEWADIILAMLGKEMKLDNLRINGFDVPRWLSPASQEKLKKFIPQLERPVSFEGYCGNVHRRFADYMDRGYSVRAIRGGMSIQYCARGPSQSRSAASHLVISSSNDV